MTNPFNYEKLARPEDFCGREHEIRTLKQLVKDGKNIVLFGDRRYGKTSLIEHVYRDLPKRYLTAFADLFACVDAYDVATALYRAVYEALPFQLERKLQEIGSMFKRLSVDIKPTADGSVSFIPKPTERDFDTLIEDALIGADQWCQKKNHQLVIALDEFQQIAQITDRQVDAILRQHMQRLECISFIFSGSKKSILSGLFIDREKPLYGMASSISIGGIEPSVFFEYCNERLQHAIAWEDFHWLYTEVRGQTKLILQVCYWLYAEETEPNSSSVAATLNKVIHEKNEEFKLLFERFPTLQKKILKLIAITDGKSMFVKDNLNRVALNKQQANQPIQKMLESGDITKRDSGSYQIADIHFALWCTRELD